MIISFLLKYRYAILWAMISLTACGINGNALPKINVDFGMDKVAHFVLFGVQAWLIIWGSRVKHNASAEKIKWKSVHIAVIISLLYGIFIEGLQATVFVNRSYDFADMVADGIGTLFCYPLVFLSNSLK